MSSKVYLNAVTVTNSTSRNVVTSAMPKAHPSQNNSLCVVRSACDNNGRTAVTYSPQRSATRSGSRIACVRFTQVNAFRRLMRPVVRGRVELPTFRFSGWQTTTSDPTGSYSASQDRRAISHGNQGSVTAIEEHRSCQLSAPDGCALYT